MIGAAITLLDSRAADLNGKCLTRVWKHGSPEERRLSFKEPFRVERFRKY